MSTIVLVEANAEHGSWIASVLERRGHAVRRVCGEGEAAHYLTDPADLWIVDGELRGSALRLIPRIRKQWRADQVPILFLAGRDTEDEVLRAHAAGADAVLTPPLTQAQLIVRVKRLLDGRTAPQDVPALTLGPGSVFLDRYRIDEELGRGGNGVVFRAHDTRTGSDVALKIAEGNEQDLPESRQRIQREAYSLLAVDCAYTPQLLEFGRDPSNREYMALELIEGPTLWSRVGEEGPLPAAEGLDLLHGIALALDSLQARGMVHRDLKPGNVVLREGQPAWPVLVDFGLARNPKHDFLTDPDALLGTAGYMPPEYVLGGKLDFRSDLFSLGHVVLFAVTGQPAWPDLSGFKLLQRLTQETYPVPDAVPCPLREVLQRLVAVDPSQRPASAADLLGELEPDTSLTAPPKRSEA